MKEILNSKGEGQNPHEIMKRGEWVKRSRIRSLYAVESKSTWDE